MLDVRNFDAFQNTSFSGAVADPMGWYYTGKEFPGTRQVAVISAATTQEEMGSE